MDDSTSKEYILLTGRIADNQKKLSTACLWKTADEKQGIGVEFWLKTGHLFIYANLKGELGGGL